ncbi:MAG TPA: trigger factor, partial [Euzebya sp.]|nr:trigger factor [Euzebya sp.]
ENLDSLRERFAEVDTVDRPAQKGDFVTVTVTARKADGAVVEEASAEDLLYRIPEEDTDSELDAQLPGAAAGAVLSFTDVLGADYPDGLAGQELAFTAIVKEVKVRTLPELDDDFALTASEFDTIEELIDDLRDQIGREKRQMARSNLRGKVVETISELVDVPLPESLVEEEQRFRLNRLAHQAEHNGISFDQFLMLASGGDPQVLIDQIKTEAEETVRAQLVVDEIGQAAGIKIEQADLGQEIARQAMRLNRDPKEIAELMLHPDRIGALYADAYRRKTIDHILTKVEISNEPPEEELDSPDSVDSPDTVDSPYEGDGEDGDGDDSAE